VRNMKIPRPSEIDSTACDKDAFVEMLRKAVYGAFLASFVQGCNVSASVDISCLCMNAVGRSSLERRESRDGMSP
jgi:hypothetical protein